MQAIIVDAAGVYLKGSFHTFEKTICGTLHLAVPKNASRPEVTFDADYNRGKITADECFKKYFGVSQEQQLSYIKTVWGATWKQEPRMTALLVNLKKKYRLALLSNSDKLNSDAYRQRGWYDLFEVCVLSHEEGVLKPDKRIYDIVLERLHLPAQECVFIDDQQGNLVPAKQMGMKTVHFRSFEQCVKELRTILGDKSIPEE